MLGRYPDFLIIGAMKSGTTTLYSDLDTHPSIFFPPDKEPNNLSFDDVLSDDGKVKYSALFRNARAGSCCGEASTMYTMSPMFTGAPSRARAVMGANLRLIYIVRNPIARTLSHYRHWYQTGRLDRDLNVEIDRCPNLVDFSQYHHQLLEWTKLYSGDQILVLRFESYVSNRLIEFRRVLKFLGLAIHPKCHTEGVYNPTTSVKRLPLPVRLVVQSKAYRTHIRGLVGSGFRRRMASLLGYTRREAMVPLTPTTIRRIYEMVHGDAQLMNKFLDTPVLPETLNQAIDRFAGKWS